MDEKDLHILSLLNENSKITNSHLAETIGLSPASTLERVRKLEDKKIIEGYNTKISFPKIGLDYSFIICVKMSKESLEDKNKFLSIVRSSPSIISITKTKGSYHYLLKAHCNNHKEIYHITQNISALPNIQQVETLSFDEEIINSNFILSVDYDNHTPTSINNRKKPLGQSFTE